MKIKIIIKIFTFFGSKSVSVYFVLRIRINSDANPSYQAMGFPGGTHGKELSGQCRRYKRSDFDPCVGKILWRRAWGILTWRIPWTEEPGR